MSDSVKADAPPEAHPPPDVLPTRALNLARRALGIGLGIPTAMGLTALTLRWRGKEPQPTEVDAETVGARYRKLHHQLMRAAVVAGVLIGPFVLFGMTQVGGQLLEFVKRVVVTVTPFALVLLILSALLRGEKKY